MTERTLDVATIGDAVIDLTAAGLSESGAVLYERNPGGGPANVVATVAKLGGRAAFVGTVGDDHLGHFLAQVLRDAGVDTSGMRFSATTGTRIVFIELDERHDRDFVRYASPRADLEFESDDGRISQASRAKLFHTSLLANLSPPLSEASELALERVKSGGGLISFDPNWAAAASTDPREERQAIQRVMTSADILKLSLPELTFMLDEGSLEKACDTLLAAGPRLVVVTLGERGAYFQTRDAHGTVSAPLINVVDTTGAGDAFVGGLLYKLASDVTSADELTLLSAERLREYVTFANACGALCASRRGSLRAVPNHDDVQLLLARQIGDEA